MSLQTFKKKGIITCHGTNTSGKPAPGFSLRQGPFGSKDDIGAYQTN